MSLILNRWSLEDTKLAKTLNKQGPKRRTTAAPNGPRKGRNQVNFKRAPLSIDQTENDIILGKTVKRLCLSMCFLNINFCPSCHIDPGAVGSISYHTNSTLFCQEVTKSYLDDCQELY